MSLAKIHSTARNKSLSLFKVKEKVHVKVMASTSDTRERDPLLGEILSRIDEPDTDLLGLLEKYLGRRAKAHTALYTLKDTKSKKIELIGILEEMSVPFFKLGANLDLAIKEIDQSVQSIKECGDKIEGFTKVLYK